MKFEHTRPEDLHLVAYQLETTELTPTYRCDLRTQPPDLFVDESTTDWSRLPGRKQENLMLSKITQSTELKAHNNIIAKE